MIHSIVTELGGVLFPENTLERQYMVPFVSDLPPELSRWQTTVDTMLEGVESDGIMYLMIDQARVKGGSYHRRPGVHVDGNWNNDVRAHGSPGHQHGHTHPAPPSHRHHLHSEYTPELILLASDVSGCEAFVGKVMGNPDERGSCDHLDLTDLDRVLMQPHTTYAGNVTMLHRSLSMPEDCLRTLVRINVPHGELR